MNADVQSVIIMTLGSICGTLIVIAISLRKIADELSKISNPAQGISVGLCATNDDIPVRLRP